MDQSCLKLGDDRSVVAGFALSGGWAAFVAVDANLHASFDERCSGEDEVDAQTPAPVKGACPIATPAWPDRRDRPAPSIDHVDTDDTDATHRGGHHSGLIRQRIPGESGLGCLGGLLGENGYPCRATQTMTNDLVPGLIQNERRKVEIRQLGLLKTDDIGTLPLQKGEKTRESTSQRVDVPGDDSHRPDIATSKVSDTIRGRSQHVTGAGDGTCLSTLFPSG